MLRSKKAQGAMEYLLIIGLAILISAIVITAVPYSMQNPKKQTQDTLNAYNSLRGTISITLSDALSSTLDYATQINLPNNIGGGSNGLIVTNVETGDGNSIPIISTGTNGSGGSSVIIDTNGVPNCQCHDGVAQCDLILTLIDSSGNKFTQQAILRANCTNNAVHAWKISDCAGLQAMNSNLNANYELEKDIDCSSTNAGAGFLPIGSSSLNYSSCVTGNPETCTYWSEVMTPSNIQPFTGTLNGDGHTISGLTINRPDENFVGLFGIIENPAKISNINLAGTNVKGMYQVGAISGFNYGGTAENVHVSGDITGQNFVGGIFGSITNDASGNLGTIKRSSSEGSVTGVYRTGGLSGTGINALIEDSSSASNVHSGGEAGGIIGTIWVGSTISGCFSTGQITANNSFAGGIAGVAHGIIENSYSTGPISASDEAGGIMGGLSGATIKNCFATGSVTASTVAGGVVGDTLGGIYNSFSTARVNSDKNAGGIGGVANDGWCAGDVDTSWDETATNQSNAYGLWVHIPGRCGIDNYVNNIGVNTAGNPTYWFSHYTDPIKNWGNWVQDGASTKWQTDDGNWSICEGQGYPWLTWENRGCP